MNFPEQQHDSNNNNNGGNALASPSAYSNPSPSLLSNPDLDPSAQYGASAAAVQSPPASVLLAGYRKEFKGNGLHGRHPHNGGTSNGGSPRPSPPRASQRAPGSPMNFSRPGGGGAYALAPRYSAQLDVRDPVAMHLLVETAMGDSKEYEVLSFEEVEGLKREQALLETQIQAQRKRLVLESKVKEAAASIRDAYGRPRPDGSPQQQQRQQRPSVGGRRQSSKGSQEGVMRVSSAQMQAADEFVVAERKCEEIAKQTWLLETRLQQVRTELLCHTAGILQMTHKVPPPRMKGDANMEWVGNGMRPTSPMSMYTFEENQKGTTPIGLGFEGDFDKMSMYRLPDDLDGIIDGERKRLSRSSGSFNLKAAADLDKQNEAIASIGQRLEELNGRLRDVLVQAHPERNREYKVAPKSALENTNAVSSITQQLEYLDQALNDIGTQQDSLLQDLRSGEKAVAEKESLQKVADENQRLQGELQQSRERLAQAEESRQRQASDEENERLQAHIQEKRSLQSTLGHLNETHGTTLTRLIDLNSKLYEPLNTRSCSLGQECDAPPEEGAGHLAHLDYLSTGLTTLHETNKTLVATNEEATARAQDCQKQAEQYEVVLAGLWQIILAGEADAYERRKAAGETEEQDKDVDMTTPFALPEFSTKVQWLVTQSTDLREQLGRTTSQYETAKGELMEQLASTKKDATLQVDRVSRDLRDVQQDREKREQQLTADLKARQEQVENLEAYIAGAVQEERETRRRAEEDLEQRLEEAKRQIASVEAEREGHESRSVGLGTQLVAKDAEFETLREEVAGLKTELTIARAELEAAYGSRAERQRAADASADVQVKLEEAERRNGEMVRELENLRTLQQGSRQSSDSSSKREEMLKAELTQLVAELQDMTRAGVEAEREREDLESLVDGLNDRVDALQAELADEKVRWLGIKSPGSAVSGGGGGEGEMTSLGAMRGEFKKLVREMRGEGVRALKVSFSFMLQQRRWRGGLTTVTG